MRIEDSDRSRSTKEAVHQILESLSWLDLSYDEGPVFQSERLSRYQEAAKNLVSQGKAYLCTCSRERLDVLREEQARLGQKPRYDGRCRESGIPWGTDGAAVRFKTPQAGTVAVEDAIKGRVVFANEELDDLVILRPEGTPTYNFCVVVDDADGSISHVIRGDDHLNNTPRQIHIFEALGASLPVFAHVPMILGSDKQKLSKRHGALGVLQYREEGYLPQALLNYLFRLGYAWGDEEVFPREKMIEVFDLGRVSRSPAVFNPQKLLWLNQEYLQHTDAEEISRHLLLRFAEKKVDISRGPRVQDLIPPFRGRAKTLNDIVEGAGFFYEEPQGLDPKAQAVLTAQARGCLQALLPRLESLPEPWQAQTLHEELLVFAQDLGVKMGDVAQPLRAALSGRLVTPPIDQTLALLGKEKTLLRLRALFNRP